MDNIQYSLIYYIDGLFMTMRFKYVAGWYTEDNWVILISESWKSTQERRAF